MCVVDFGKGEDVIVVSELERQCATGCLYEQRSGCSQSPGFLRRPTFSTIHFSYDMVDSLKPHSSCSPISRCDKPAQNDVTDPARKMHPQRIVDSCNLQHFRWLIFRAKLKLTSLEGR